MIEERYCPSCRKRVRMTRCEICKGKGGGPGQCTKGCNQKGWLCPTHGGNY